MTLREELNGHTRDAVRAVLLRVASVQSDVIADLFSPANREDPYPAYARVRERGALLPLRFGAVTADHATIDAILRDPATTTATAARAETSQLPPLQRWLFGPPDRGDLVDPLGTDTMIGVDGDQHARLRRIVSSVFTPAAIAGLRPRLEQIVGGLVDRAVAAGTADLMTDVASVFPIVAVCEILGVPADDHARFKQWGNALAADIDAMPSWPQERAARDALRELQSYLVGLIAERRADPRDDVLSQLTAADRGSAEDDGPAGPLTDRELLGTCMLLLVAGFETTVNLIGNGTLAMLRAPEQLAWLREDVDQRVAGAVEELLRYDSPVQYAARFLGRSMETTTGVAPPGTAVTMVLGGANRDPAVFARADELDLGRDDARRHLAFASGPHYCLGASLARLEGELFLRALLERTRTVELAAPPVRRPTFALRGLQHLPLRLVAG